jgi:F0F1-type ATP synthase alpha subunit
VPMPVEQQFLIIYAGNNDYLNEIPTNLIAAYEAA